MERCANSQCSQNELGALIAITLENISRIGKKHQRSSGISCRTTRCPVSSINPSATSWSCTFCIPINSRVSVWEEFSDFRFMSPFFNLPETWYSTQHCIYSTYLPSAKSFRFARNIFGFTRIIFD